MAWVWACSGSSGCVGNRRGVSLLYSGAVWVWGGWAGPDQGLVLSGPTNRKGWDMGQGVTGACKTRGLPGSRGVCSSVRLRLRIRLHACGPRTTGSKRCLFVPSRDICDWVGAKRLDCCRQHDGQLVGHSPEFAVVSETSTIDLNILASFEKRGSERRAGTSTPSY
jgi:hypothetical protein